MKSNKVVGIYLAAGYSNRMGEDKLALPFGDFPLGAIALKKALQSQLDQVFVVINSRGVPNWLADFLALGSGSETCKIVICPDAEEGVSRSIRTGVQEALAIKARACMVLLADQPLITTDMVDMIIETYRSYRTRNQKIRYVASCTGTIICPPLLFSNEAFMDLLHLNGDQGAKQILDDMLGIKINFQEKSFFYDVDCKEQYKEILSYWMKKKAVQLAPITRD